RRLYDAFGGPKQIVVVPGADHNDQVLLAGDRLVAAVVRFLDEHVTP
ncbi:MAG: alpha/beta hydrolase, partial [Actinobacteria bacterium]|nr:alpha/beta hydrolase [Actinomycetota bacterium]NIT98104.1 alpha/beta hydrolase [Actinomycetota bacterium]NIX53082.1 alpha/beta hydrolase [Actinomycetota bacterium]